MNIFCLLFLNLFMVGASTIAKSSNASLEFGSRLGLGVRVRVVFRALSSSLP